MKLWERCRIHRPRRPACFPACRVVRGIPPRSRSSVLKAPMGCGRCFAVSHTPATSELEQNQWPEPVSSGVWPVNTVQPPATPADRASPWRSSPFDDAMTRAEACWEANAETWARKRVGRARRDPRPGEHARPSLPRCRSWPDGRGHRFRRQGRQHGELARRGTRLNTCRGPHGRSVRRGSCNGRLWPKPYRQSEAAGKRVS